MAQWRLLDERDMEPLSQAVCEVLERVGVLCQNADTLAALEVMGAQVDHEAQRARFPIALTLDFIQSLRDAAGLDADSVTADTPEDMRRIQQRPFVSPNLPTLGTQVAQFYYDWPSRSARPGNREDFITLVKLADVLHPDVGAGHALLLTETHPLLEPLEAALLLAEYSSNPGPAFAWNVAQTDYLDEMGQILGIEEWYTWGSNCFAHPLRFDRDVVDKYYRRTLEGDPAGMNAMPIAAFTTPATVEGFIAVSAAEHVAAWMTARAINPDVSLRGSLWAGTIDMRTGGVSYCAFDAMHRAFAVVEFLERWCGVSVSVGGGEYCSAKVPGMQAALEKAYKALTIAAFTGHHPVIGQGMLDNGRMLAPVQLLLERDMATGVQHFARPVEPTRENIGLSGVFEVDLGLETNHLISDHTLHHFRRALWLPEFIHRSGFEGYEQETAMLDCIQQRMEELLTQYRKPEGRENQLARMREVVERARVELPGRKTKA
jgi:trimethylamine:corrinoid methyltransferase-like protein